MEEKELREQLSITEGSLCFLLAIIAGIFLSFRATVVQRDALCAQLLGKKGDTSSVYPLRHTANSLVIGALGYFLCLAIKTWREGSADDRTAGMGVWAALLVFAAAVIRFDSLEESR